MVVDQIWLDEIGIPQNNFAFGRNDVLQTPTQKQLYHLRLIFNFLTFYFGIITDPEEATTAA